MAAQALWSAASERLGAVSRWGLLPYAVVFAGIAAARLGAIAVPTAPPRARGLLGAVAVLAAIVISVRALGALGTLTGRALFVVLGAITVVLLVAHRSRTLDLAWGALVSRETSAIAVMAGLAVFVAALAAYYLPVWQWDSLGYHLPYVNFALQRGTLADVPRDVPYLSTYPHAIEQFFAFWRAMLPDDRLVDMAQIPLGLLGAAAVAYLAREFGARGDHALAAGLLWLMFPAVFLQLPTNYIDVGCAALLLTACAFTLSAPTPGNVVGAGVAMGLFLGSKPNAPLGTALVLAVLSWRAWKAGQNKALVSSLALAFLIGAESYVANIARYGNPVWPVSLTIGPLSLPGTEPMQKLLDAGAAAPRLHGPLILRLVRSWTALDAPPMFDMRYGGLGPVFLAALPVALMVAYRRRSPALAVVALAMLASPDPSMARYILAFPGLVLALAAPAVSRMAARTRLITLGAAAAVSGFLLVRAYPALAGEGPLLVRYPHMTEPERLRAVGADGRTTPFYDALDRLGPGDSTVYDASLELPYLAWPPDLSCPVRRVPDDVDPAEAERILGDPHVRLLIVDRASPVANAARARNDTFTQLFQCKSSACVVFLRT